MEVFPPHDKLPPSGNRALIDDSRLGLHRRQDLRTLAEGVLLDSPESKAVQNILDPAWGDIRKNEWQRIAVAALDASGDLRAKLKAAEDKLDAICLTLEGE